MHLISLGNVIKSFCWRTQCSAMTDIVNWTTIFKGLMKFYKIWLSVSIQCQLYPINIFYKQIYVTISLKTWCVFLAKAHSPFPPFKANSTIIRTEDGKNSRAGLKYQFLNLMLTLIFLFLKLKKWLFLYKPSLCEDLFPSSLDMTKWSLENIYYKPLVMHVRRFYKSYWLCIQGHYIIAVSGAQDYT